jgi:hypothetical protein
MLNQCLLSQLSKRGLRVSKKLVPALLALHLCNQKSSKGVLLFWGKLGCGCDRCLKGLGHDI